MKVGSILPVDDFCGTQFSTEKGGVLTVVGIVGKSWSNKKYGLVCSICHTDTEMFDEYFESTKSHLNIGRLPCGCAKNPRLNERQIIIKINRKCTEKNYKFIGFVGGTYVNNKTKLILECPIHGQWDSTTYNSFFQKNSGCTSCGRESTTESHRLTHEEATKIVEDICKERNLKFIGFVGGSYINNQTKLILSCQIHGHWDSTGYSDFTKENGNGCPNCGKENFYNSKRLTQEEAISNIKKICKEKNYKFIGFVGGTYVNNKTKLILECPIHGQWDSTTYNNFQKEYGCPKCGGVAKITQEEAISNIKKICKEKNLKFIGFVGGSFVNCYNKLILSCPIHGQWDSTTYNSFIRGTNCGGCAKTGYDKSKPGYLYIYKYKFKHLPVVYKFGITNRTPKKRSNEHIKGIDKSQIEHQECVFKKKWEDGSIPDKIESLLCEKYKGVCDWLTSGNTETFNESDYQDVLNIINNFKEE